MMNLDLECAIRSEKIMISLTPNAKKEAHRLITKALGVLQEDGIYAFYLYLRAEGTPIYKNVELESKALMKTVFPDIDVSGDGTAVAKQLVGVPEYLLTAKELLERTLVYARYHAKAIGGE